MAIPAVVDINPQLFTTGEALQTLLQRLHCRLGTVQEHVRFFLRLDAQVQTQVHNRVIRGRDIRAALARDITLELPVKRLVYYALARVFLRISIASVRDMELIQ